MKKKIAVTALSMLIALGTTTACFASGSIGHGNMSVFKGEQLIDKLSGQNPIAESSLLVCDGKCMVKSKGISLVAADQAKFAIQNEDSVFNLYVRSGKVEYVINDNARKIAFHTPEGSYTVADVIFNAGSSPVVRGSVQVSDSGETEIEVTEGRLVFATGDGVKAVDANNKIVLAVVPTAGAGAVAAGSGLSTAAIAGGILVATAVVVTTVVVVDNNSSSSSTGASQPTAPTPTSKTSVASPSS